MNPTLFTRNGREVTTNIRRNSKGPYTLEPRACGRCGGAGGADKWKHTGWKCFDCNGSGEHINGPSVVRLYTAEQLDKLNARKAKTDATRLAKAKAKADAAQAAADARREDFLTAYGDLLARMERHAPKSEFVADVLARAMQRFEMSEKQIDAVVASMDRADERERLRAGSDHVGQIGGRIETAVTVERTHTFYRPSFSGFGDEAVNIVTMRTAEGNAIVSKSSSFAAAKGDAFTIRATVKEHSSYNGERQTLVQRVKVLRAA